MTGATYRYFLVAGGILGLLLATYLLWPQPKALPTIADDLAQFPYVKESVLSDFTSYPLVALTEEYTITDTLKDGVEITYGNRASSDNPNNPSLRGTTGGSDEAIQNTTFSGPDLADSLSLQFPQDLQEPLTITLPGNRTFTVTHQVEGEYTTELLTNVTELERSYLEEERSDGKGLTSASSVEAPTPTYLKYTSPDSRLHTYYAYQKDQAAGYRNLKHWTIFTHGDGRELQQYRFSNAHLTTNERGEVEVRYLPSPSTEGLGTEAVEEDLWARAQRVIREDQLATIENNPPDLTIPAPFTIDANGTHVTHEWVVTRAAAINPNDTSGDYVLSVSFTVPLLGYPIALDPTLQFTAPGTSNSGDVITGEAQNNSFGVSMTTGDWNGDGKVDLAVGANVSFGTGSIYIFWSSDRPSDAVEADVIITGEESNDLFGVVLTTGDFNGDGVDDLAVTAEEYDGVSTLVGRAYIYYGGNIVSGTADTADVIITGEFGGDRFGRALAAGDLNNDGTDDLVVTTEYYNGAQGRVYIYYGGNMVSENETDADVAITGDVIGYWLGQSVAVGDYNGDGQDDLAVGAEVIDRVFVFYGGSIVTENASSGADVVLIGEANSFGSALSTADLNGDGQDDLIVGAYTHNSYQGRAYVFYGGSMVSENASGADVTLTGEGTNNYFGYSLTTGDFNTDGIDDLAVGALGYNSSQGRAYIFYGGSMVSENASAADVILTGEASSGFGWSITTGDINNDGKDDLIVGAYGYNTNQGRTYIFYSQSGQVNLNDHITGEGTGDYFGSAFAVGDFNNDGRDDLAVGAYKDNTNTGKVYIFYNTGSYPTAASTADVIITGGATNNFFGGSLTTGDFNADGRDDLAVGAYNYSSGTGRAYLFYNDGSIPTTAATADVTITGEGTNNYFGASLTTGDWNADGRDDLAVGAHFHSSQTGRAYIFYGDGSIPTTAATADVVITGEATGNRFGRSLINGDYNADGRDDLAVGAYTYSADTGRAYIFYGDGSIPTTAATADVVITGENPDDYFGWSFASGDFNGDGTDDLAVGAFGYNASSFTGRAYIFYGDGPIPTTAATADVTITGEGTNNSFGVSLTTGDFNADGTDDLAVGAWSYSSYTGRAYIYHGGTFTASMEAATSSSLMITGDSANDDFGFALATGDFNADGKDDLVIGAPGYDNGGDTGRVYFYETREDYAWEIQRQSLVDGLRVDPLMGYEMKITGEATSNQFASAIAMADLNNDGKDDLIVGARSYNSNQGKIYIFYNDGNYPTKGGRADVVITGEATGNYFGSSLTTGDFNGDGRDDLAVGAYGYNSFQGRVYIFYGDGSIATTAGNADVTITGEATSNDFGGALTTGDIDSDGRDDLIVSAQFYSNETGRVYIFYGDGSIPTSAGSADVIITGEDSYNYFGWSLITGDFNGDGREDLAVGAVGYSTGFYTFDGRTYIFFGDGSIPTSAGSADVIITGEGSNDYFGSSLATGDFNNDGREDLAVSSPEDASLTGRVYIFYGDGSIPTSAGSADVIITGEGSDHYFGGALTTGDIDSDGRDDLIVGADLYSGDSGRAYVFYGRNLSTGSADTADVILTGENTSDTYGITLFSGDLNNDGTDDLLVGATGYNSNQGRLYFYTTNDRHMTGEGTDSFFGSSFAVGDFNADGKNDLAVGAYGYNNRGRIYVFYGGAAATTSASGANVTISETGLSNRFGDSLTTGDLNGDGIDDLIEGGYVGGLAGEVHVFYGGSWPATFNDTDADVTITGESSSHLGAAVAVGDFNNDGIDDVVAGAPRYSSYTGRAYIFYGGTLGASLGAAADADVIITGESTNNDFGESFTVGDFNADGIDDLVVGAYDYTYGRAYVYYGGALGASLAAATDADVIYSGTINNDFGYSLASGDWDGDGVDDLAVGERYANDPSVSAGAVHIFYGGAMSSASSTEADITITGESSSSYFGTALASGDFNKDGRDDLAVGADSYSSNTGRAYLFYGDELRTTGAENANVIVTGEKTNGSFGYALAAGDLSGNGVDDLIIGAYNYDDPTITNNDEGRVYIITSEAAAERQSMHRFQGTIKFQGTGTFH